jgi:hypothetical protein
MTLLMVPCAPARDEEWKALSHSPPRNAIPEPATKLIIGPSETSLGCRLTRSTSADRRR